MKIFKSLRTQFQAMCIAFCAMSAYAQSGEAPTQETSLEDTQRWIVEKIHEIGTFTDNDGGNRRDIFFEGCQFTDTLGVGAVDKNNGRVSFRVMRGSLSDLSEQITQGRDGQHSFLTLETSGGRSFPTNWGVSYDPALLTMIVGNGDAVAAADLIKRTLDPESAVSKAAATVGYNFLDRTFFSFAWSDQTTQERLLNAFIHAGKLCRMREGKVRGRIGVAPKTVTREVAVLFGLSVSSGVLVTVEQGGPAAQAGMLSGDVIVKWDGKDIGSADQLAAVISAIRPGTNRDVQIVRNHVAQTLSVKVGERPAEGPTIAGLGPLRSYANVTFLRDQRGSTSPRTVRFSEGVDGSISVSDCNPDGTGCIRYAGAPSGAPGQFNLTQVFYSTAKSQGEEAGEWRLSTDYEYEISGAWKDGILTFHYSRSWRDGYAFGLLKQSLTYTDQYWVQGGRVMYRETGSVDGDKTFDSKYQLRAANEYSLASAKEDLAEARRYKADYDALTRPSNDGSAGQALVADLARMQNGVARVTNIHTQTMANIQAQAEERNRLQRDQADRTRAQESRQRADTQQLTQAAQSVRSSTVEIQQGQEKAQSTSPGQTLTTGKPSNTFIQKFKYGYTGYCFPEEDGAKCKASIEHEVQLRRAANEQGGFLSSSDSNGGWTRRVPNGQPVLCTSKPSISRQGTQWTCTQRVDYTVSSSYSPDAIDPQRDVVHKDGFFVE